MRGKIKKNPRKSAMMSGDWNIILESNNTNYCAAQTRRTEQPQKRPQP